jgi:glyoxylase-like metal-dependent hydrolase (beta-lactamase superfamily II)
MSFFFLTKDGIMRLRERGGQGMELKAFETDSKITSYKFEMENKRIMVDCGSGDIRKWDVENLDYLFISHAHMDHWEQLYNLAPDINENCLIMATETTRRLIIEEVRERLSVDGSNDAVWQKKMDVFQRIVVCYFMKTVRLSDNLEVTFFPSGHMYGSAMIYLTTPSVRLFYTGDMDYAAKDVNRQYDCPQVYADILIVDGTMLIKDDFKKQWVGKLVHTVENINPITINVRPEKAVILARMLAEQKVFDGHVIIYERDLLKYLKIMYEQGYEVFETNKIILGNNRNIQYPKYISLSSKQYQKYNKDWTFGLHISREDMIRFIHEKFHHPTKVYLSHYNLKDYEELKLLYAPYDYQLLVVGNNTVGV